ncbi:MAG: tRNA uridine-5-carboxymethylaminomethyl(34) synthesis GTPase MnmE [Gemmatimonadetes bacterium]|nr:tRNA uridine-5-carboxymethylaminomethyl(34) synthesis GTPase MnmE [Gemmatimonadota bacterium]
MDVDTIAAVSTAPGRGAVAIVRVSGPQAVGVLLRLAPELSEAPEARRVTLVELRDPHDGSPLDRALATFFPRPASYTGEDVVELSCHGGSLVPELVMDACVQAGARRADPGEFTRRAYLRGKVDLVQAEAVADLIEARSRALHRAALTQLEQGLSERLGMLRGAIVRIEALLVHHIDFPEEDEPPVPVGVIVEQADLVLAEIDRLLATAPEGELLREGALAVLAGRPNAGKSSLYNALLGEERAIVTEEPGTTRDALVATVALGGFPFRLVDTAGLREAGERVERIGIEVTRRYLERADVVLFCVPGDSPPTEEERVFVRERMGVPVVWVETKSDLVAASTAGAGEPGVACRVRVSTRTGEGLDELRRALPGLVYSGVVAASPDAPVITRRRHRRGLEAARAEVASFRSSLEGGLPAEVAASHLRPAENALEEVVGTIARESVLDAVFAEFCVGK